jgi:hypothetical protein
LLFFIRLTGLSGTGRYGRTKPGAQAGKPETLVQKAQAVEDSVPHRRGTTGFGQLPENALLQAEDFFRVLALVGLAKLVVQCGHLPEAPYHSVSDITGKSRRFDQSRDPRNLGPKCFHHALPRFLISESGILSGSLAAEKANCAPKLLRCEEASHFGP